MLELLRHLVALQWRRSGAALREATAAGSRIWYAEFTAQEAAGASHERALPLRALPWQRGSAPSPSPSRAPPALVLLHGLGASAASFHPVIPRLREGYRVVVPDLPGHGWSHPPRGKPFLRFGELLDAAEAFVERIAPEGAYLAGNSMGGWIAAKLAARRPDLARGMALLNPGGPALNAEDWTDFNRILAGDEADAAHQLVARLFHRPPFGARLVTRELRRMLRAPSVLQLVSTLEAEDFISEEELARVECPSVLIWGENDRFIPEGCRSFFLEKLPRVRYHPVPDCGHCPQLECPRRTAEILLALPRMRRHYLVPRPRGRARSRPRPPAPRVAGPKRDAASA